MQVSSEPHQGRSAARAVAAGGGWNNHRESDDMSDTDLQLDDGSHAATPDDLFRRLDELEIVHDTIHHDPVFTVEEAKSLRGELAGAHTKI